MGKPKRPTFRVAVYRRDLSSPTPRATRIGTRKTATQEHVAEILLIQGGMRKRGTGNRPILRRVS